MTTPWPMIHPRWLLSYMLWWGTPSRDRLLKFGRSGKRRKKGFGFVAHDQRVSPGNCTVGRLMSDQRFTEAILSFLEGTQIGLIKKGVIVRGEEAA